MTSDLFRLGRRAALLAALLFAATSCVTMTPPEGFLVLEKGARQWKATSPEDARLWVRDFTDEHGGALSFWTETLKQDLVNNRGYTLLSEGRCADAGGNEGRELLLETSVGGRPYRELLCLFVHEGPLSNRIRVVEFVAERPAFEAEVEDVRAAIRTLRP